MSPEDRLPTTRPRSSSMETERYRAPILPAPEPTGRWTGRRRAMVGAAVVAALGAGLVVSGLLIDRGDGTDLNELLQRGVRLQRSGQLDEAAAVYRDVLAADGENTVALFNLGVLHHSNGETEEAADSYVEALSIDPRYAPALFNLAILRAEEGNTKSAAELYRRLLTIEPDHARASLNLGILLLDDGEVEEGSELIRRAVELDPSLEQRESSSAPQVSGPSGPDAGD